MVHVSMVATFSSSVHVYYSSLVVPVHLVADSFHASKCRICRLVVKFGGEIGCGFDLDLSARLDNAMPGSL